MKRQMFVALLSAVLGLSSLANAELINRGGGLIYDTALNITWLQDANYAGTLGYNPTYQGNGLMTFTQATTFVSDLVYGGYDDWRLPSALNADGSGPYYFWDDIAAGHRLSTSEFAHLYHDEGITSQHPGPFVNVQPTPTNFTTYVSYMTGTIAPNNPLGSSKNVDFYFGINRPPYTGGYHNLTCDGPACWSYVWPVRDGDVAAPVPIPGTIFLLAPSLAALVVIRRRFKK